MGMANAWYVFFGVIFLVVFGVKARRMNKEAEDKIQNEAQMQLQQPQHQPQYEQGTAYKSLEGGDERVQQQQQQQQQPQPTYTTTATDPPVLEHNGETCVT